jgi:hypothetical protein
LQNDISTSDYDPEDWEQIEYTLRIYLKYGGIYIYRVIQEESALLWEMIV